MDAITFTPLKDDVCRVRTVGLSTSIHQQKNERGVALASKSPSFNGFLSDTGVHAWDVTIRQCTPG